MAIIYTKDKFQSVNQNEDVFVGVSEVSNLICVITKEDYNEHKIRIRAFNEYRDNHKMEIMSYAQALMSGFEDELRNETEVKPLSKEEIEINEKISKMKLYVKQSYYEVFVFEELNQSIIVAFNEEELAQGSCDCDLVVTTTTENKYPVTMM